MSLAHAREGRYAERGSVLIHERISDGVIKMFRSLSLSLSLSNDRGRTAVTPCTVRAYEMKIIIRPVDRHAELARSFIRGHTRFIGLSGGRSVIV